MGRASAVAFYRLTIDHIQHVQEKNNWFPVFRKANVLDYVGRNTRLEIQNDQRLIISQMLAQPYEMIPEIENMPWDLEDHDIGSRAPDCYELQAKQNELYPS